ncbi:hypothetical protein [Synechococcus sp. PCC 7336]|nr:hypothetical protein [Synechococcus sp. PCC 7336]
MTDPNCDGGRRARGMERVFRRDGDRPSQKSAQSAFERTALAAIVKLKLL